MLPSQPDKFKLSVTEKENPKCANSLVTNSDKPSSPECDTSLVSSSSITSSAQIVKLPRSVPPVWPQIIKLPQVCNQLRNWVLHTEENSKCANRSAYTSAKPGSLSPALAFLSRHMEHTLCLEQLYSCLFQPLCSCTSTNMWLIYSQQTCRWSESTQWEPSNRTRLIRVDQWQGSKSAKR